MIASPRTHGTLLGYIANWRFRQLENIDRRKENADVTGRIKMVNTQHRYGFISAEDGKDYFLHSSECLAGESGFGELQQGDAVTFEPVTPQPPKGPRATAVTMGAATVGSAAARL